MGPRTVRRSHGVYWDLESLGRSFRVLCKSGRHKKMMLITMTGREAVSFQRLNCGLYNKRVTCGTLVPSFPQVAFHSIPH